MIYCQDDKPFTELIMHNAGHVTNFVLFFYHYAFCLACFFIF